MTEFYHHKIECATKIKKFEKNIRIMKQYWNYKKINALMSNIKSRYVDDEATKLTKRYSNEYKKIVKLMQQTILLKKKQIHRDIKIIIEYIVFDFKNVINNDYKNRTTFISSKLKNVEFKWKDERLIENVSKIVFF